jgi:carboxymethylenebutenolidase
VTGSGQLGFRGRPSSRSDHRVSAVILTGNLRAVTRTRQTCAYHPRTTEGELKMCHEPAGRPPAPPIVHRAAATRHAVLRAADGNDFAAFGATTDVVDAPGVVILPDVRGLHPFYEALAVRFSQAGAHAVAIDYYGRTAGNSPRGDDFNWKPHFTQVRDSTVALDVAAATAFLMSPLGGRAARVFTVGFCFGGRISFNQAASGLDLAGVIGFYGRVVEEEPGDNGAPLNLIHAYRCPVLGFFGGDDPKITPEHATAFRQALEAAGVDNEVVVYDNAPHSFFDRTVTDHEAAARDAWTRMLRFMSPRDGSDAN